MEVKKNMALLLLAITPLHIILFAVVGFLLALLILLAVIFACGKKRSNGENDGEEEKDAPASSSPESPRTDDASISGGQTSEELPEEVFSAAVQSPAMIAEQPVETPADEVPESEAQRSVPAADEAPAVGAQQSAEVPSDEETQGGQILSEREQASAGGEVRPPEEGRAEILQPALADARDKPVRVSYVAEDGWFVRVRYDKSFEAKLIQGDEALKKWYSALKNELLSYQKVTARRSWQHEAFRLGRTTIAKFVIRGKTLRLYLALSPAQYVGSKYLVEDASEHAKFEKTPLLYRIRNDRRCRYAADLIAAAVAAANGIRGEAQPHDYSAIPFEDTASLIERGLVRIVEVRRRTDGAGGTQLPEDFADLEEPEEDDLPGEDGEQPEEPEEAPAPVPEPEQESDPSAEHRVSVTAAERLMTDEEALILPAERSSDNFRQTIVNIDTLGEYFSDGERVTIDEMRERIPFFDKRATAVKVLARGVLTKTLEVEADDFSLAAVKMILLLGGKAYVRGK